MGGHSPALSTNLPNFKYPQPQSNLIMATQEWPALPKQERVVAQQAKQLIKSFD
jgi:hypothetical protein